MGKKYEFVKKGKEYTLWKRKSDGLLRRRYHRDGRWQNHSKTGSRY